MARTRPPPRRRPGRLPLPRWQPPVDRGQRLDADRARRLPDDPGRCRRRRTPATSSSSLPAPTTRRSPWTTDDLTIRGLDRNTVILDGEFELENGVRVARRQRRGRREHDGARTTPATASSGPASRATAARTSPRTAPATTASTPSTRCKGQFDHIYAAGSPDAGVYIGAVLPVRRGDHRRARRAQRARLLGHQLGRQPADRQLGVPQQPGRHRAQQRQLRAVLPRARDHHRRQRGVLQQPGRHAGHRRGAAGDGQRHPRRRRRRATSSSATSSTTTTRPASVWCRSSKKTPTTMCPTPDEWTQTCDEQKDAKRRTDPGGPILWDSQQQPGHRQRVGGQPARATSSSLLPGRTSPRWATASAATPSPQPPRSGWRRSLRATAPAGRGRRSGTTWWPGSVRHTPRRWTGRQRRCPPLPTQDNMPDAATRPSAPGDRCTDGGRSGDHRSAVQTRWVKSFESWMLRVHPGSRHCPRDYGCGWRPSAVDT